MSALRNAFFPSIARRLIVSLLAAAAIIVGLLAMHTLNLPSDDRIGTEITASAVHGHAAFHPAAHTTCADLCPSDMPSHKMTTMACVLALLLLILVVGIPVMLRLHTTTAGPSLPSRWSSTEVAPRPPSLHVLSISRT